MISKKNARIKRELLIQRTKKEPFHSILSLIEFFLEYEFYENSKASNSIKKYRDCLRCTIKHIGDPPVESITHSTIISLKKALQEGGSKAQRIASIINTLRIFLRYCQEQHNLNVLDFRKLKPPKIPRKIPVFLTDDELVQFLKNIKLTNQDGSTYIPGLRFRTLIELIMATGLRISETLSIRLDDIDYSERETKICGKGNKERYVYLNDRSVKWIRQYLAERNSDNEFLFVTRDGKRQLPVHDLWRFSKRYRDAAGLDKQVTPHMFRRTFATKLRDNGVDITIISELLGHADIQTTAKYYIGSNRKRNKEVHREFLHYELGDS